jgi:hypothetical protein
MSGRAALPARASLDYLQMADELGEIADQAHACGRVLTDRMSARDGARVQKSSSIGVPGFDWTRPRCVAHPDPVWRSKPMWSATAADASVKLKSLYLELVDSGR